MKGTFDKTLLFMWSTRKSSKFRKTLWEQGILSYSMHIIKIMMISILHSVIINRHIRNSGTFKAQSNLLTAPYNTADQTISGALPPASIQRSDTSESTTHYFAWRRAEHTGRTPTTKDRSSFLLLWPPLTCLYTPVHQEDHTACQQRSTAFTDSLKHNCRNLAYRQISAACISFTLRNRKQERNKEGSG